MQLKMLSPFIPSVGKDSPPGVVWKQRETLLELIASILANFLNRNLGIQTTSGSELAAHKVSQKNKIIQEISMCPLPDN